MTILFLQKSQIWNFYSNKNAQKFSTQVDIVKKIKMVIGGEGKCSKVFDIPDSSQEDSLNRRKIMLSESVDQRGTLVDLGRKHRLEFLLSIKVWGGERGAIFWEFGVIFRREIVTRLINPFEGQLGVLSVGLDLPSERERQFIWNWNWRDGMLFDSRIRRAVLNIGH